MDRQLFIIRCSDGWMCSHYGTYDEAVQKALTHIGKRSVTYKII